MKIFQNTNFKIFKIKIGPILTNCYIVFNNVGDAAIVDFADFDEKIIEIFQKNKLNLKFVLLTHGHFDHIMGLQNGLEKLNSNCYIYINKFDKELLNNSIKNASFDYNFTLNLSNLNVHTFSENCEFILDDKVKFKAISTPGHTKGSSSFLLNNEILFTGDALFKNNVGRTDLFSGDAIQMLKTIAKLKQLNKNLLVLPGHGPMTNLKDEFKNNPHFQI